MLIVFTRRQHVLVIVDMSVRPYVRVSVRHGLEVRCWLIADVRNRIKLNVVHVNICEILGRK